MSLSASVRPQAGTETGRGEAAIERDTEHGSACLIEVLTEGQLKHSTGSSEQGLRHDGHLFLSPIFSMSLYYSGARSIPTWLFSETSGLGQGSEGEIARDGRGRTPSSVRPRRDFMGQMRTHRKPTRTCPLEIGANAFTMTTTSLFIRISREYDQILRIEYEARQTFFLTTY